MNEAIVLHQRSVIVMIRCYLHTFMAEKLFWKVEIAWLGDLITVPASPRAFYHL